ncbi:V4R domain-containing protein [Chamaesiphon sp. OTE_8_metabat_110]|uniref:V4R domain-containing protein n=1 Tax=Chamaesiphon sp. OTE_8_metabat_110 TaxID=2964696 RepID=UPI00286D0BA5|nr:V4R domain-containing protein [Chamaesiphon sp. OTE_8_metabat_110]
MISQDRKQIVRDTPNPIISTKDVAHYNRSQFFQFDMAQGKIADYHRQRNLLVGEDFIVSLLKGLEHEVGDAAGWLCYEIGLEWGKQDAVLFQSWFQEFYKLTLETSNLGFAMETWWWPYTVQGWGTWSPNLDNRASGFFYVDLYDSAVAKTLGYMGKPVCHMYSGILAGFFSVAFKQNLCSTEIQCYAMGNDFCRFLIGSEERIQAAEFWLSSGAKANEIAERFEAGEVAPDNELSIAAGAV